MNMMTAANMRNYYDFISEEEEANQCIQCLYQIIHKVSRMGATQISVSHWTDKNQKPFVLSNTQVKKIVSCFELGGYSIEVETKPYYKKIFHLKW